MPALGVTCPACSTQFMVDVPPPPPPPVTPPTGPTLSEILAAFADALRDYAERHGAHPRGSTPP